MKDWPGMWPVPVALALRKAEVGGSFDPKSWRPPGQHRETLSQKLFKYKYYKLKRGRNMFESTELEFISFTGIEI